MAVIQSCMFYVVRRFPGRGDAIKRLFRENENFHTICEDYGLCAEALKRWSQSTTREAQARSSEYAELLDDLESEIRKYLDEFEEKEGL
jgi:hypothetical protein